MNPNLVEYSTKNFLFNKLQQCHGNRVHIYSYVLNIGILLIFILVVYFALYFSRKHKLTVAERKFRMMKEQEYILSKIKRFQQLEENNKDSLYSNITDLPSMR